MTVRVYDPTLDPGEHRSWARVFDGQKTLVEAVPGRRIRVLAVSCLADKGVMVELRSLDRQDSYPTPISADKNGSFIMPETKAGWFLTEPGEALAVRVMGPEAACLDIIWCIA